MYYIVSVCKRLDRFLQALVILGKVVKSELHLLSPFYYKQAIYMVVVKYTIAYCI